MKRTVILLAALAAVLPASSATAPAETPQKELRLRVSTHHGYLPLELLLKGDLRGVDLTAIQSCAIRVDRHYTHPSGMKVEERSEHPCVAPTDPAAAVPETFETRLTLEEPGDYLLRIMLQPKDGRPIAGMTHPVRVFRSSIELGHRTTID